MDYSDFLKYLSNNCNDANTFFDLAMIEARFGKEAVLGMVSGPPINQPSPIPTEPHDFFDLLYYFPDQVWTCNNDLQYNKTLSTSGFVYPNGTSAYLNNDTTFLVDYNNNGKKYFVFCVHINRVNIDNNYNINFNIGLPNYTSDASSYQYLVFTQIPNSNLFIPDHRDTGHGATKPIVDGVSFASLTHAAYTYHNNSITWADNNINMETVNDSYLFLVGKKNSSWNYTVYPSIFRFWYDDDNNPQSLLMAEFDSFNLVGTGYNYFIPTINCINTTNQTSTASFQIHIIQWNWLDESAKPFLLTDDLKYFLKDIELN